MGDNSGANFNSHTWLFFNLLTLPLSTILKLISALKLHSNPTHLPYCGCYQCLHYEGLRKSYMPPSHIPSHSKYIHVLHILAFFFLQSWGVFVDGQPMVIHVFRRLSHRHQTKTIVNSPFCFPVSYTKVYTEHLNLDATLILEILSCRSQIEP